MKKLSILFALTALITMIGCGSSESSMSKKEEQDFKGKPVPPDVLAKMKADSQKNAGK